MSVVRANTYQDASGGSNAVLYGVAAPTGSMGFRNRILNGNMVIDQRNAGASVTPSSSATGYAVDRWALNVSQNSKFSAQQSSSFVGFSKSLLITSLSAYSVTSGDYFMVDQNIEGFNVADLGWGTANAVSVTLSFRVKSSLTGNFGGVISNSANNRSYPFSYTISAANTETTISVTIPGDTSGTWLTDNGTGMKVRFAMGAGTTYQGTANAWAGATYLTPPSMVSVVGTNGATWQITGVQLEAGSVASPFERVEYGAMLRACQRYYYKQQATDANARFATGYNNQTTTSVAMVFFPASMRAAPTALEQSGSAGDYRITHQNTATTCSSVPTFSSADVWGSTSVFTVASGLTQGQGCFIRSVNSSAYLAWSAEL